MKWKLGFGLVLCFLCLGFMTAPVVTGLAYDTLPSESGLVVDGVVCEYESACDTNSAFSPAPEVADFGQPSACDTNFAFLGYVPPGKSRPQFDERYTRLDERCTRLDERCTRLEQLLVQFVQRSEYQEAETLACRRGRRGRRGAACGVYETSHAAELLAVASCAHEQPVVAAD